ENLRWGSSGRLGGSLREEGGRERANDGWESGGERRVFGSHRLRLDAPFRQHGKRGLLRLGHSRTATLPDLEAATGVVPHHQPQPPSLLHSLLGRLPFRPFAPLWKRATPRAQKPPIFLPDVLGNFRLVDRGEQVILGSP